MSSYSLFFDNTDRMNYGCRATSLALHSLLAAGGDTVRSFHGSLREVRIAESVTAAQSFRSLGKQALLSVNAISALAGRIDAVSDDPATTIRTLKRRARYDAQINNALRAIDNSDAIFVNGEGSMIFTTPARPDLLMQLAVLAYAQSVGVEANYVNAMVSPCPTSGVNAATVDTAFDVLRGCGVVYVRDPQSYRFMRELGYQSSNAALVPDALFDWSITQADLLAHSPAPKAIEPFPESYVSLSRPATSGPVACISAASISPGVKREGWVPAFVRLVEGLRQAVGEVIVVVPDVGDDFLLSVAATLDAPVLRADTNVLSAASVLSSADIYVSGRYHPSIMASLGGTPLVHFGSNSHKCAGLRELLELPAVETLTVDGDGFVEETLRQVREVLGVGSRATAAERSRQLGRDVRDAYSRFWSDADAARDLAGGIASELSGL